MHQRAFIWLVGSIMYCFVSIRQCKKTPTVKDAHYAIISSQKITHKTHSQHSRYCLGGLRCPTEPSGSQGRCVPAGGQPGAHPHGAGSRPCCRMQWECAGHRGSSGCLSHPVPSHATTQAGMEHGCGAAWAPRAVAAMATQPGARGIRRAH